MAQNQRRAARKEENVAQTPAPAGAFRIERVFDASPEQLWAFWTDQKKFARWFNPAPDLGLVIHEYEVRPGGHVRFDMPQPDGNRNPQEGIFHVLDPYEHIVSGAPDKSFLIDVRFGRVGGRTRMTVTVTGAPPDVYERATKGWNAGFDKLERALEAPTASEESGTGGARRPELKEIEVTRVFDAPVEHLWKSWTDPEWVKRWWGPKVFTSPAAKVDLRVGGKYLFCMRGPDGKDYWSTGVYREIAPMSRIVCTDSFADEKGQVVPATHYGLSADYPLELQITVAFEDLGGKTRMTVRQFGHPVGEMYDGAHQGWNESLDKLAESLGPSAIGRETDTPGSRMVISMPTDKEVVGSTVFDAPRERVFDAYTNRRTLPEWWGPRGFTTRVEQMHLEPGGAWRFVQLGPDKKEYAFKGTYTEVRKPERIVQTFEFEGMPGHVLIQTAMFEELPGGRTKVTTRTVYATTEDRDEMLKTGMESGWRDSMDRLGELLRRISSAQ